MKETKKKVSRKGLRTLASLLSAAMLLSSVPIVGNAANVPLLDNGFTTTIKNVGFPKNTPEENLFTYDEYKYILLDTDEASETSRYFIMMEKKPGDSVVYSGNHAPKFDPATAPEGHLAIKLNTVFLDGGWSDMYCLPNEISSKVDRQHVWDTEGGLEVVGPTTNDRAEFEAYSFTAGATLPSYSEVIYYKDKIGQKTYATLRTGAISSSNRMRSINGDTIDAQEVNIGSGKKNIFPCFWVSKDFFAGIKLDLATAGINVKKEIIKVPEATLLEIGYKQSEIDSLKEGGLSGNLFVGQTLSANFLMECDSYKWYRSDSAEGSWEEIASTEISSYTITGNEQGKYIKVELINGEDVVAEAVSGQVSDKQDNTLMSATKFGQPSETPEEVAFTIAGEDKQYVLLDSDAKSSTSAFFVLADFSIENLPKYKNQKWDPTISDTGERAVWMNNADAATLKINEQLYNAIDKNHVWYTENGAYDGPVPEGYTFTAGATVLSLGEIKKYASKIRYGSDFDWGMLRTGSVEDKNRMLRTSYDGYIYNDLPVSNNGDIRPCFWIGDSFFKTVKLDLSKTGDDVKEAIKERYKPSELADLYTADEIASLGYTIGVYDFAYNVSQLKDATSVKASATIVNAQTGEQPVTMIVVIYNEKGGMVKAMMNSKKITGEDTLDVTVDMTGLTPATGWKAATFIWNDVKDMTPLSAPYYLEY